MGLGMKEYILVNTEGEYIVEELNMCAHLWVYRNHNPQTLMNYVVQKHLGYECNKLSVITKDRNSLTVYSYPVWSVFHR